MLYLEIGLVLTLIVLNGLLALSEMALVSARKAKLQTMARSGHRGAQAALVLLGNPGRFLSAIQIGITLVGILAGAFSGVTLAVRLSIFLQEFLTWSEALAEPIAYGFVVATITYISLIVGELVPKQIALARAEDYAAIFARPMLLLTRLAKPAVWVLERSSSLILRLFSRTASSRSINEEEIRLLIAEAQEMGVVEPEETSIISRVMRLGDRSIRSVMTPRSAVEWIDLEDSWSENYKHIRQTTHLWLPAASRTVDNVSGALCVKDILDVLLDGKEPNLKALVRPVPALPEGIDLLDALRTLGNNTTGLGFVVDEYGGFEGIVTSSDLMNAMTGQLNQTDSDDENGIFRRKDGTLLIDGTTPLAELSEILGVTLQGDDVHTIGGLVMAKLRRVPHVGDHIEIESWHLEIVDMDGRRIDKLLATPSQLKAA